jgi:hypothetical protein
MDPDTVSARVLAGLSRLGIVIDLLGGVLGVLFIWQRGEGRIV